MQKKINILVGITAASLVFNLYSVRILERRSDEISQLEGRIDQVITNVNSSIGNLSSQIQNLKAGSAWLLSDRFIPQQAGSTREQVNLLYEVTLREVGSSSRVYLQYRETGTTEWTRLPTTRQGGLFSTAVSLATDKQYEYQVAEEGSLIRSGEVSPLPYTYYESSLRFQGINGGSGTSGNPAGDHLKKLTMDFWQGPVYFDFQKVKAVQAELRLNQELVKTVDLTLADQDGSPAKQDYAAGTAVMEVSFEKESIWRLYLDDVTVTDIVLQVEYADGTSEQIVAWPNPEESFR